MSHIYKILNFNSHDIKIDEKIYDQIKWFNEKGYVTGESCLGGRNRRDEIEPLYIVFTRLNKNQKRILSKICKKLKIKFQLVYLYIVSYPRERRSPFGMEISIKGEENRVELLNRVIAQLEQLHMKNSSKKVKAINKGFS